MKPNEFSFDRDPGVEKLLHEVISYTQATESYLLREVDKPGSRPNDRRMTDLNRQQVTDMLAASEAKVDARLANFDTSIKTGFADLATAMARQAAAMEKQTDALRVELAKQSGDLRTEMANGRADATKQNSDSMRWIILAVFTMISISVAIIGVMINLNKGEKAAGQTSEQQAHVPAQQAPVIVAVPAAGVLLSAPPAPAAAPAESPK